jgi:hypothetical protein
VPKRAISGPHDVPYVVSLHHEQLHVTKAVTWLHDVSRYNTSDTKQNDLQFRFEYQFTPKSRSQIYEQTYHWQISAFLLTTLSHTHTSQNSFFYTNSQSNNGESHRYIAYRLNIPKQLAAAAPRHLLFYGWVHRATNIGKTDSTNTTTAILVPA